MCTLLSQLDRLLEVGDTLLELGNTLIEERRPNRYVRWRTDCPLHCAESLATPMCRRLVMRLDSQVQQAAIRNHALGTRFTAQAGVSTNVGRVPIAGQVTSDLAN